MQEDKNLKLLLLKGALEKASPAFTANVMEAVAKTRISKSVYQSLVCARCIRIYRLIFLFVLSLLVIVGMLIKSLQSPFTIHMQLPVAYFKFGQTIIIYVIAFWALILLNNKLENKTKKYI